MISRPYQLHHQAMRLAVEQRVDEAVALLAEGLSAARELAEPSMVLTLARSAAVVCEQQGKLMDALAHYAEAERITPDDLLLILHIGDLYARVGEIDQAQQHWARFEAMASASEDPEAHELLEHYRARRLKKGDR